MKIEEPTIPLTSKGIQKGVPLKNVLGLEAVTQMGRNLQYASIDFPVESFYQEALDGLDALGLMERGRQVARALRSTLPSDYSTAVQVLVHSMTPARATVGDLGVSTFFYLPYGTFLSEYGSAQREFFDASMWGLQELTMRFTSEYAIRAFLLVDEEQTLSQINDWLVHPNPHVRRLCSEGTRPLLPWGKKLPRFLEDPERTRWILEALRDDHTLYVRRSVANHLGDLAKSHKEWVFLLCHEWLQDATADRQWMVRHAVRYWAKQHDPQALEIRKKAGGRQL